MSEQTGEGMEMMYEADAVVRLPEHGAAWKGDLQPVLFCGRMAAVPTTVQSAIPLTSKIPAEREANRHHPGCL
jgi:hypothetical protein